MDTAHLNTKKHCYNCAYRNSIPGDAHSECMRSFKNIPIPELNEHGIKNGWCLFPINFDPIWVGKCEGFDTERKEVRKEADALLKLLSMLR